MGERRENRGSIRGEEIRREWENGGQNEKERRERGYLSVQAKLVLFDVHERQKNNNG